MKTILTQTLNKKLKLDCYWLSVPKNRLKFNLKPLLPSCVCEHAQGEFGMAMKVYDYLSIASVLFNLSMNI